MVPIILISLVGSIGYVVWVIVTACKRSWKKLGIQLAAGGCFIGILYVANMINHRYVLAQYYSDLFHTSAKLSSPLFSYDSPRAFNGDGYSIEVYPLPAAIRDRFEKFDAKAMEGYPKKPEYRNHWNASQWCETPALPKDQKYLAFALGTSFGSAEVARFQVSIRNILSKKGSYLAYFYYDHGDYPGNVDLFLIDLTGDRIYLINFNT